MTPDRQLLCRYADQADEAAFAELVKIHLPLVYGVALRMGNGNAPLAEDVAQRVFAILARRAAGLANHPTLAGWLHTTTRYLASKAVREEHRRRAREIEAATMPELNTTPALDWAKLQPDLDDALARLHDRERSIVLLRFFEDKTYPEIEATLGLRASTAHKQSERALEKVRRHFARRGVTTTAALLVSAMTAHAAPPVPVGLAAKVSNASLVGAAGAGGLAQFIGEIFFMTTKTKIIIAIVVFIILGAIPVAIYFSASSPLPISAPSFYKFYEKDAKAAVVTPPSRPVVVTAPKLTAAPATTVQTASAVKTPAGSLNPVTEQTIIDNLRKITVAASQHMLDAGVTEVNYSDILNYNAGENVKIQDIAPVAGEDYSGLTIRQSQSEFTISTSDGNTVTFDL